MAIKMIKKLKKIKKLKEWLMTDDWAEGLTKDWRSDCYIDWLRAFISKAKGNLQQTWVELRMVKM